MRLATTLSIAAIMFSGAALAGDEAYMDDRSTGASLISSYYNALNRHEYARAWDYWHEGERGDDYFAFADSFPAMQSFKVSTGEEMVEGAVGSLYYSVPIAVEISMGDGTPKVQAGCAKLRMTQPVMQEESFESIRILAISLMDADTPFMETAPGVCDM